MAHFYIENYMEQHLRIARATNDLDRIVAMYGDGLGFGVIGRFEGHDGFDGVMLGRPDSGYHLEFTRQPGHHVEGAPTKENLLIFYVPDRDLWEMACERAAAAGFLPVESHNPYWDKLGHTFEDPDGYRIVLQRATWPTAVKDTKNQFSAHTEPKAE